MALDTARLIPLLALTACEPKTQDTTAEVLALHQTLETCLKGTDHLSGETDYEKFRYEVHNNPNGLTIYVLEKPLVRWAVTSAIKRAPLPGARALTDITEDPLTHTYSVEFDPGQVHVAWVKMEGEKEKTVYNNTSLTSLNPKLQTQYLEDLNLVVSELCKPEQP